MPAPASVVIPTRDRAGYLGVALDSVVPQARAAGAEVLVVRDGPDAESAAVASARGVRTISHARSRGLNAARNTGIAETSGELVVFVDDDVEVRPGWLEALLGAAASGPVVDVFAGPVFARFEDHPFRMCGREGPPVTFLDLGPVDVDAPHAWGANLAIRRPALEAGGGLAAAARRVRGGGALRGGGGAVRGRGGVAGPAAGEGAAADPLRGGRGARPPAG